MTLKSSRTENDISGMGASEIAEQTIRGVEFYQYLRLPAPFKNYITQQV